MWPVRVITFALVFTALPLAPANAYEGDPMLGARLFQLCYACHTVDPEETQQLPGPTLHGIVGRPAAAIEDYEYSGAMREKAGEGLVWTREALDEYLADPEAMIPGTSMAVNGIPDPRERADLIAYLAKAGETEKPDNGEAAPAPAQKPPGSAEKKSDD